jgi:hypothetical protein
MNALGGYTMLLKFDRCLIIIKKEVVIHGPTLKPRIQILIPRVVGAGAGPLPQRQGVLHKRDEAA